MPTTDRKHDILLAAQDLLQTRGYAGFSYQDLSDRLGIAKPSIHHHFATKEALALALVEGLRARGVVQVMVYDHNEQLRIQALGEQIRTL